MTLSIEASFVAHIEKNVFAFTLMGTKGGATFNDGELQIFTDMDGGMVNITPSFVGKADHFEVKMQSWVEALRGQPDRSPGEDGLKVQKVLDGIYASSDAGREVRVG
jgi:predicted dehydrogenase